MTLFLIDQHNAVCCDPGARFHGWLFKRHIDGQFVSVRKLQEANPFPISHPLTALLSTASPATGPEVGGRMVKLTDGQRDDGSDIPLGEELRKAAAKIAELAKEIEDFRSCLATASGKLMVAERKLVERDAELARAHDNFIKAWEALPGCRYYSVETMQKWIMDDMKPAVDHARAARKSMEDTDG